MGDKSDVRVRRAYDEPEPDDGTRVLVDRIWPRGLTKDKASLDLWFKQDQRGCRARRPDQGLSRAVLVSTIGCTPACSTSTVSSPRRRGAHRRLEGDVRRLPRGNGRR